MIAALAWGYLGAAVLVAALMWGFGDRNALGTVLLFMGRWVFLVPLALLVPAALLSYRPGLVPLAVGALIVLGPVMGFRTGWRRLLPQPEGTPIRVVTFNAGSGGYVAQMVPTLLACSCDRIPPSVIPIIPRPASSVNARRDSRASKASDIELQKRMEVNVVKLSLKR